MTTEEFIAATYERNGGRDAVIARVPLEACVALVEALQRQQEPDHA